MKKIIKTFLVIILIMILPQKINAATASVSISGPTTLYPGQTGTYTITFNASESSYFSYDVSGVNLSLSGPTSNKVLGQGERKSESITIYATANTAGSTTRISVSGSSAPTGPSAGEENKLSNSLSISVINRPAEKSGNNFLSSLSTNQGNINFNRNTNAYRLEVDNNVSTINLSGTAEHSKASISGLGSRSLKLYSNVLYVTVTAENGSQRSYSIEVIRKDSEGNTRALSDDNNLSEVEIQGCKIDFSSSTLEYNCEVDNLVKDLNISVKTSDTNASYKIENEKDLIVGNNEVKITVTSENGSDKLYIINVERSGKEPIVDIENIDDALTNITADGVIIIMDENVKVIEKSILEKFKNAKKLLILQKRDIENNILYQWKFDGNKIEEIYDINIDVKFDSLNNGLIDKLSNYAKGYILSFEKNEKLPDNTEFGMYLNDKDYTELNLYYLDLESQELVLKENNLKLDDNIVWLALNHTSEYFLTPSTIANNKSDLTFDLWTYLSIGLGVFILLLLFVLIKQNRRIKFLRSRVINETH